MTQGDMIALAKQTAQRHALAPEIVCAVCEQESSWNPWAIRFEPAFERRYIRPALTVAPSTEELALAMSWGLMQVMGETAREHGFDGSFLTNLCDPAMGLEFGCRVLSRKFDLSSGNIMRGLFLWNGGSNAKYPLQVFDKAKRYQ